MDKQPVGQLPDLTQSNNDDEIMVITNSEYNQLKKEKISDLITDFTSTNENNALTKGTDGKLFVTDFGNASNITEGTLPVSVLPDIPKDKLPEIEITDLPESGVTADTYAYPSSVTVNAQGMVTAIAEGTPSGANADTDLSNLTPAGEKHFLNKTQITNCLLEVPQRVKVRMDGTSLVLEAGSVVIVPYGTSAPELEIGDTLNGGEIVDISWDGSKLFYFVKYGSDINYSYSPSNTYEDVVCISSQGACLSRGIDNNFSSDTAPVVTHAYNTWYDTANNIMKWTDTSGSVWNEYCSFPLCTAMVEKNVGFNYIKNIFNGVGFIGYAFWCDKGVKGLAPNGRNADGTLRNLEIEAQHVIVNPDIGGGAHRTLFLTGDKTLWSTANDFVQSYTPDYNESITASWYNPAENQYYNWSINNQVWDAASFIKLGWFATTTSGNYTRIAEFNSSQKSMPFQALDYNDAEFIAHQAMPSGDTVTLSLPASNGTLTATADGYAVINATTTSANGMVSLNIVNSANGKKVLQDLKKPSSNGALMATSLPVAKGDLIQVGYQDISLNFFQFVYANGAI